MEQVQDVMTPNPCAISPEASVMDAAQIMRECDIGDVIVLEDWFRHSHGSRHRRARSAEGLNWTARWWARFCGAHHHRAHGQCKRR
jgi:hypothetical protein